MASGLIWFVNEIENRKKGRKEYYKRIVIIIDEATPLLKNSLMLDTLKHIAAWGISWGYI